jgi:Zn-dependent protease/predicted transcriptional regulator
MGRGFKIGRIFGVEVRGDSSLLLLVALITINLREFFANPFRFPGLGGSSALALAALTSVLFVASILAHELAHALMFRARGIPVRGITLYMLGGVTQGEAEAKHPIDEFLVTFVGPLTTAILGVVFLLLHGHMSFPHPSRSMFGYLAFLNLLMAVFNVLPGFPLDGGRMLLAGIWRLTGSRARATQIAARIGQAFAVLIMAAGIYLVLRDGVAGIWPAIIGLFLFRSASAAVFEGVRQTMLEAATAADVMSAPPPTVPADLILSRATEIFLEGHDGEAFPVLEDGHVAGFISLRTAKDGWPSRPVREAMAPATTIVEVAPDERMDVVAERIAQRGVKTALVLDGGQLVGVIEPEDVNRFFRKLRGDGRLKGRGQEPVSQPPPIPPPPSAS